MLPAFLATILFAISGTCASRTSRLLGGIEANFWRIVLGMTALGLYAHLLGAGLRGDALPIFFLSGVAGYGLGDVALYQALPRIGSRFSIMLVHCLAAPCAALTEWLWLGTTLSLGQAASSAVILLGVALALYPDKRVVMPPNIFRIGITCGVIAGLCQGWGAVLSRKAYSVATAAAQPIDGVSAAYQRIWGGFAIALLTFIWIKFRNRASGPQPDQQPKPWRAAAPWLLANAMVGPALGVACYQWALATTPTGIVLPIVALTPLAIIPIAFYVEKERPSLHSILGGIVAVAGVIGLTMARK